MRFQPIVDTSGHRVLGHECLSQSVNCNWNELAGQAPSSRGLCFITSPAPMLAKCLRALTGPAGLDAEHLVFQVGDWDAGLVDLPRRYGARVALCTSGATPGYLDAIGMVRPDFVKIDSRLTRNAEEPACAGAIAAIVEGCDRFGLKVIAEGVDKPRTIENLWLLGVEIMQGDMFGAPVFQVMRMSFDVTRLARSLAKQRVQTKAARLEEDD